MINHHRGAYYMPTTPWTASPKQEIDKEAYFKQIQRLIPAARSIICGAATGEAYEIAPREMIDLVAIAIKAAGGKANVYGSLPWETASAVSVCESIMELGAAGAMELPPTYAYVGQHGIEQRGLQVDRRAPLEQRLRPEPEMPQVARHLRVHRLA